MRHFLWVWSLEQVGNYCSARCKDVLSIGEQIPGRGRSYNLNGHCCDSLQLGWHNMCSLDQHHNQVQLLTLMPGTLTPERKVILSSKQEMVVDNRQTVCSEIEDQQAVA